MDESKIWGLKSLSGLVGVVHPSGAVHQSFAGPEGRLGINFEPEPDWFYENHIDTSIFRSYRFIHQSASTFRLLRAGIRSLNGVLLQDLFVDLLSESEVNTSESMAWHRKLDDLLSQDQAQCWTLKKLAHELAVHPVYLSRVFRKRYGQSISVYLHESRMLRAVNAIISEPESISEIASTCHFADHAHLSNCFRKEFGIPPREFRKLVS